MTARCTVPAVLICNLNLVQSQSVIAPRRGPDGSTFVVWLPRARRHGHSPARGSNAGICAPDHSDGLLIVMGTTRTSSTGSGNFNRFLKRLQYSYVLIPISFLQ